MKSICEVAYVEKMAHFIMRGNDKYDDNSGREYAQNMPDYMLCLMFNARLQKETVFNSS